MRRSRAMLLLGCFLTGSAARADDLGWKPLAPPAPAEPTPYTLKLLAEPQPDGGPGWRAASIPLPQPAPQVPLPLPATTVGTGETPPIPAPPPPPTGGLIFDPPKPAAFRSANPPPAVSSPVSRIDGRMVQIPSVLPVPPAPPEPPAATPKTDPLESLPAPRPLQTIPPKKDTDAPATRLADSPAARPANLPQPSTQSPGLVWGAGPGCVPAAAAAVPVPAGGGPGGGVPVRHRTFGSRNLTISRDFHFLDLFGLSLPGDDAEVIGPDAVGAAPATDNFFVQAEYLLWWVGRQDIPVLASTGTPASLGFLGQPGTTTLLGPGGFGSTAPERDAGPGRRVARGGGRPRDRRELFSSSGRNPSRSTRTRTSTRSSPARSSPRTSTRRPAGRSASSASWWRSPASRPGNLPHPDDEFAVGRGREPEVRRLPDVRQPDRVVPRLPLPEPARIADRDRDDHRPARQPDRPGRHAGGGAGLVRHEEPLLRGADRPGRRPAVGPARLRRPGVGRARGHPPNPEHRGVPEPASGPGQAPMLYTGGGLLAAGPNLGEFTKDRFSVVPEVTLNLGYMVTPNFRTYVGYNFLYWTNVIRPGQQIDRVVDLTNVPNGPAGVLPSGLNRPLPTFTQTDLLVTGIQFGAEFRW